MTNPQHVRHGSPRGAKGAIEPCQKPAQPTISVSTEAASGLPFFMHNKDTMHMRDNLKPIGSLLLVGRAMKVQILDANGQVLAEDIPTE